MHFGSECCKLSSRICFFCQETGVSAKIERGGRRIKATAEDQQPQPTSALEDSATLRLNWNRVARLMNWGRA